MGESEWCMEISLRNTRSAGMSTIYRKQSWKRHSAVSYTHLDVYKRQGYTVFTSGQDTYSCPDMNILVKHIQDVIKTENIYTQTDTKTYPPAIMYRTSSSRPFYRLSPAHSYVITAEDNKIDALGPDITTTFTEKLQAQKFTLRSENSMADLYYGYSLTSFEKDGWLYTIELGQGMGSGIGIELTCASSSIKDSQAAKDFDEIADVQRCV